MALSAEVLDPAGRCTSPYALVRKQKGRGCLYKSECGGGGRGTARERSLVKKVIWYGMLQSLTGREGWWSCGVGDHGDEGDPGGSSSTAKLGGTGLPTQQMLRSSSWSRVVGTYEYDTTCYV